LGLGVRKGRGKEEQEASWEPEALMRAERLRVAKLTNKADMLLKNRAMALAVWVKP